MRLVPPAVRVHIPPVHNHTFQKKKQSQGKERKFPPYNSSNTTFGPKCFWNSRFFFLIFICGIMVWQQIMSLLFISSSTGGSTSSFNMDWNVPRTLLSNTATTNTNKTITKQEDLTCIFRDSPLYRSIYVYPIPGSHEWKTNESGVVIGTQQPENNKAEHSYPWIQMNERARQQGIGPYDLESQLMQYNTELLVQEIMIHPDSCLRSHDPETAKLFYIPYLPSAEFHDSVLMGNYSTTIYGQAILNAIEESSRQWKSQPNVDDAKSHATSNSNNTNVRRSSGMDLWKEHFGWTTKYWERRHGADHILVFSEPMHGLWHPRSKRGSFHFIHTQKQLDPPIVLSVEVSKTFVQMYPHCSRKNIVLPYPNTDGRWFNGRLDSEASSHELYKGQREFRLLDTQLDVERRLSQNVSWALSTATGNDDDDFRRQPKPLSQFYSAGNHGTCATHRKSLQADYACTFSGKYMSEHKLKYPIGYRLSTACPCPGGDSPSAKRMFDALHGGCIPIILSEDYVWPFSPEFDTILPEAGKMTSSMHRLNPVDFSIRLDASNYLNPRKDGQCQLIPNGPDPSQEIQAILENLSVSEIRRLRDGAAYASDIYAWYRRRPDLPDNPLREGVLPDGGAAHALVAALAERAEGSFWPACQEERRRQSVQKLVDPRQFKC